MYHLNREPSSDANKCHNVYSNLQNGLETLYGIISGADTSPSQKQLYDNFGVNVTSKDEALLWAYNDLITPIGQIAVQNTLYQHVCVPFKDAFVGSDSGYYALQVLYRHLQALPKLPTSSAWVWQSCRELGLFETTSGSNQPFQQFQELTGNFLSGKACTGDFVRDSSMPSVDQINRNYGGLQIGSTVPNMTFIHGCNDPWLKVLDLYFLFPIHIDIIL